MKTLLYATDYSDNSIAALKLANVIRKKLGAKLFVLHVFDISVTFMSTVSLAYAKMEEAAFKEHRERLAEFCKEHLKEDMDEENIGIAVGQNGLASQGILEKAEYLKPELILVGMKGSSAVRDFLVGSTATALINKSPVPVLVVPEDFTGGEIKTIVYATAFEEADISAVEKLIVLAEVFGAGLNLIHFSTKKEYAGEDQLHWFREMLEQKVSYQPLHFEFRFSEDVFQSLMDYVEEVKPDLLVMLEREGHQLISDLWHRDLVKRIKLETRVPLMSIHKKELQVQ